ncbi:MAG: ATP-binding protein [Bacteroidales bacterium]
MQSILTSLKSINYWEGEPGFNLGFIRESYLRKITGALGNKLIKVIIGQRRSGKSYIVRQIIHTLIHKKSVSPKNIFYLNKELYEFEPVKTDSDLAALFQLYRQEINPAGKVYIFIDEIQNIAGWEKIVVSLAQHVAEDYEVFITGSNSRLLSGELAGHLSGRYLLFEVFPFSYPEFLEFFSYHNTKESLIRYVQTSGLPEIYNIESTDIHRHYFQSLKDTILLKDIMHRHNIRDYVLLEDLFLFLLHNVGNLISIPSIVKYFKSRQRKADYATISAYIEYMEQAFVVRSCSRLSMKTKELLSGEKKYYVNDLGFRNYLFPSLIRDFAGMLENIVYMHLRMAGYDVKTGSQRDTEVDFVATYNDAVQYIQVAYLIPSEQTLNREFRSLEAINNNFPKYVLTLDDMTINHQQGIIHKQIWEFIASL